MNNWPQISIIVINDGHSEKSQRHHARFAQKEIHKLDYRGIINVGDFGGTIQKIETFQNCQSARNINKTARRPELVRQISKVF